MNEWDWQDPYADDEAGRERERRRAEREARRRERQGSVGDKVAEQQAGDQPRSDDDGAPSSSEGTATAPADEAGPPPLAPPPEYRSAPTPTATEQSSPASPPEPAAPPEQPDPGTLWARRGVGAIIVLALAALLVFGLAKVIDRIGGGEPQAAPVAEPEVRDLLVPEGLDRSQIADLADEAGLKGDYERASKTFKGFDPVKYGADPAPPNLEGFLFPATYELPKRGTVDDLVSRQLDAFEANIKDVDLSYAESKNLNVYDLLKIASMIEREIQVPEERKLAAAVIYNRLRAGDTLGIDATIRYEDQNYDKQLTQSRLAEDTPYNTRVNPGLPPTPIGNPGLASIEAAAHPARSDVYYFVVKPGTCGEHVFVETEEEFAQAEADYQAALEAQGGSPTDC